MEKSVYFLMYTNLGQLEKEFIHTIKHVCFV